jgi:hypothetical protein
MKVDIALLLAALIAIHPIAKDNAPSELAQGLMNVVPTMNLSAIREIRCDDPADATKQHYWTGSGSLIAKDTVLTDLHVADGIRCIDKTTNEPLTMFKKDEAHDLALMTGKLPTMPYIKISCEPFRAGQEYSAYGISPYWSEENLFRQVNVSGTSEYMDISYSDGGEALHLHRLKGNIVPGMSGGPITDRDGKSHGNVVASQSGIFGLPTGEMYSYDYTETFLCKPDKKPDKAE